MEVAILWETMKGRAAIVLLVVGAALLISSLAWAEDTEAAKSGSFEWLSNLSLETRLTYRFRSMGDDQDSDFYHHWFLRGRNFFDNWFDFYFSGRLHGDLDGSSSSQAYDLFAGVEDRDSDWQEQIYQL